MLNHISVQGRLTADPELRSANGVSVTNFTIACERDFAQDGKRETDFVSVICWRQSAEFVAKYFRKGGMIVVDGRLQSRKWTDKDGNKRIGWEILADRTYFCEKQNVSTSTFEDLGAGGDLPF